MRPRGKDLADVVFPPVQSDLFRVIRGRRHVELWCDGQHGDWHDRVVTIPTRSPRLSELFEAAAAHEKKWHR